MNIILIGHKSSGKTSLARALHEASNLALIDLDDEILKVYPDYSSIANLYREKGESAFREAESTVLQSIKADDAILATGAGVVLNPRNRAYLSGLGYVVYLKASQATLNQRNTQRDQTGILSQKQDDYAERDRYYVEIADTVLDADLPISVLLEAILKVLNHGK